jgi:phenylalanyl-tRNA synthetase beta subunit
MWTLFGLIGTVHGVFYPLRNAGCTLSGGLLRLQDPLYVFLRIMGSSIDDWRINAVINVINTTLASFCHHMVTFSLFNTNKKHVLLMFQLTA